MGDGGRRGRVIASGHDDPNSSRAATLYGLPRLTAWRVAQGHQPQQQQVLFLFTWTLVAGRLLFSHGKHAQARLGILLFYLLK